MVFINDNEKKRTQAFINEKKRQWEREQDLNETCARNKGESYQRQEFPEISEEDALQAVRAGWQSELDLMFDRKGRREGWKK